MGKFYISALNYIEDINYSKNQKIIEVNLSLHFNRIFKVGANHHVDLRSPNCANDYLVMIKMVIFILQMKQGC